MASRDEIAYFVRILAHGMHNDRIGEMAGEYADALKARLRAAAPGAAVEERFLGPADLARIFAATLLNLHPPLYDAYGMTVVEAASQGVLPACPPCALQPLPGRRRCTCFALIRSSC